MLQIQRRRQMPSVRAAAGRDAQVEVASTGLQRLCSIEPLGEERGRVHGGYEGFRVFAAAGIATVPRATPFFNTPLLFSPATAASVFDSIHLSSFSVDSPKKRLSPSTFA